VALNGSPKRGLCDPTRKQHTPEFRNKALKLAERDQEMSVEIACLKRQLVERDEENIHTPELAILQKASTYFAKRLK
jgi:transposase